MALALAQYLPGSIAVLESGRAEAGWDARRSARLRWYRYQVRLSRQRLPLGPRAWRFHRAGSTNPGGVDLGRVEAGLELLRGEHDFTGFRSADCQAKRTWLDLQQATVTRAGEVVAFDFKCRSFLHHMVRFMVGTLMTVGTGQMSLERMGRIVEGGSGRN